jgi:hypothetical protein
VPTLREMAIEQLTLTTSDGVSLEAERALPPHGRAVRAGMVLCHPHPLNGGTMRSIVISALFNGLPDDGVSCLTEATASASMQSPRSMHWPPNFRSRRR